MNATPLKLGFIGLGIMGAPMCNHLIAAGHQLFVNTRGKMPANIAESSATQCTTVRGVAERADIIFVMVPDTPDVEEVLFAEDGLASGLKGSTDKIVVDMSSISPVATKEFAKRIQAPPVLAVSRRAFGFDHREAQNPLHFTRNYLQLKNKLISQQNGGSTDV